MNTSVFSSPPAPFPFPPPPVPLPPPAAPEGCEKGINIFSVRICIQEWMIVAAGAVVSLLVLCVFCCYCHNRCYRCLRRCARCCCADCCSTNSGEGSPRDATGREGSKGKGKGKGKEFKPAEDIVEMQQTELPWGWVEAKDADGNQYWFNEHDSEVSWTSPGMTSPGPGAKATPSGATQASRIQYTPARSSTRKGRFSCKRRPLDQADIDLASVLDGARLSSDYDLEDEEADNGMVNIRISMGTGSLQQQSASAEGLPASIAAGWDLPPGWEEHFDGGVPYYYHPRSRKTTWSKPSMA